MYCNQYFTLLVYLLINFGSGVYAQQFSERTYDSLIMGHSWEYSYDQLKYWGSNWGCLCAVQAL